MYDHHAEVELLYTLSTVFFRFTELVNRLPNQNDRDHSLFRTICWTCASPIANQLRYEALRSEQEVATSDTDVDTNTENIRSHLIRTCNIPDNTIPDAINHDAIAHIRKCVRQVIMNKPHECGLSRHPAPYIQPTRVPFGYGDLVGNSFKYRSSRTAQIYLLIAPSLEHIKNDHGVHTTYTTIQLRVPGILPHGSRYATPNTHIWQSSISRISLVT